MNPRFDLYTQSIKFIPDWTFVLIALVFMAGCFAAGVRQSSIGGISMVLVGLSMVQGFCFLMKYRHDESAPFGSQMVLYAMISIPYSIMAQMTFIEYNGIILMVLYFLLIAALFVFMFMASIVFVFMVSIVMVWASILFRLGNRQYRPKFIG